MFWVLQNEKLSFPKSLSSFWNEKHAFEANVIVTKTKNTLSKRYLKCFWSVFDLYKMKKHAFETFPCLQNENTLLKRFSFLQNEKKIALKRMSSLQNEDTYFRNVFMFTKWKTHFWGVLMFIKYRICLWSVFHVYKMKLSVFEAISYFRNEKTRFWSVFHVYEMKNTFLKPLHVYKMRKILVAETFLCLQDEKDVYEACFMSTESN